MTDKDSRGGIVSSFLPMSCRGSADVFARNLHLRLKTLDIDNQEEDVDQNERLEELETSPLSPEEEAEDPLSNGAATSDIHLNPDGLSTSQETKCDSCCETGTVPISSSSKCNGNDLGCYCPGEKSSLPLPSSSRSSAGSPVDNLLESCSSVDELYETASDQSADEDEAWGGSENRSKLSKFLQQKSEIKASLSSIRAENNIQDKQLEPSIVITCEGENDNATVSTSSSSNRDEEEGFPDETIPKIRRCSSLKSGKTPPGTPSSKKIVRFADALGLDLADVKTFVDEIPKVPTSAYHDLTNLDDESDMIHMKPCANSKPERTLIAMFQQPGGLADFVDKVRNNFVSLENAMVEDPISCAIRGMVRVRNIDFHKSVFIRYSTDSWKNFIDVQAKYVENSCDGFSDKFSFLIYANMLGPGEILEFAVVFQARGEQFWDNNKGANYCFQCISTRAPVLPPVTQDLPARWDDDQWSAGFY